LIWLCANSGAGQFREKHIRDRAAGLVTKKTGIKGSP
jgi:hypothetical protein